MARVLLAVNQRNLLVTAQAYQSSQGDLGGISRQRKHGFTENSATHANAVQTSNELTAHPGFNTVGMACCMKGAISLDHRWHDPGAVLFFAFFSCAIGNYRLKVVVYPDFTFRVGTKFLECLAQ